MPSISKRKNSDGTTSFVAQVRIRPYRPTAKAFADRKAAQAWANQLEMTFTEERRRSAAVRADVGSLTFKGLVEEYLRDPETQRLASYDKVEAYLAWWVEQHGTVRALEFGPLTVRAARGKLLKTCAPATVNRYLAAARACINFGRAGGILPPSCVWPPGLMLSEPKSRARFLTDGELAALLEAARADSDFMYAAVMFAVGVGCRQGEQLRVRWGDIDEATATVAIRVTKSDTSRRAHLPQAVSAALKAWRGGKVVPLPARLVFGDAQGKQLPNYMLIGRWKKLRKAAGLPKLRWHDLRHASASFLIQGGASLAEVAHQLGHLNVATTNRYAHLVPGAKPTGADKLNEKLSGGSKT